MERTAAARAYYDALDGHEYDRLSQLLAEEFVHERPDRTFEGRDRFVRFMCEERPQSETSHAVERVLTAEDDVAVQGRLLAGDGSEITAFVDVFSFDADGNLLLIRTYTH